MPVWWLPQLNPRGLSQGDIIRPLISGSAIFPQVSLRGPQPMKKGKTGWAEDNFAPDNNGDGHYLARGKMVPCLVVSHSCDLDKPKDNARVLVAPVMPLSRFPEEGREAVRQHLTINLFPIVQVPELGEEHCADLRCISHMNRKLVDSCERLASMSDQGMQLLQAHLVDFFTRIKVAGNNFDKVG